MTLEDNRFWEKYTTLIGHITFLALAIMAVVFWRERTIMLDAAFQSFEVINKGHLAIQAQRFGAAFVQSFPLWTSKLGLSLKWVLISYSLSFVIFHYLLFIICDKLLKVKQLALGIVFFTTLMTVHTFFWVQNEVIQGISLLFVYFAFLINRERGSKLKWFDYFIGILLLITVIYFHPLTVFAFIFCVGFFLISKKRLINPKTLKMSLLFWVIIMILKVFITKVSSYDTGSMGRLINNIQTPLKYLVKGEGVKLFLSHCFNDFAIIVIMIVLITFFYIKKKDLRKLSLFLTSTIVYILIVLISFYDSKDWFYVESQLLPLSVILILSLIFDIIPSLTNKRWIFSLVCLLIVFKLVHISYSSQIYTKRLQYLNDLLEYTYKFNNTKFMTDNDYINQNKLLMHWGCAYETLYISLLKSPDSTRSIAIYDEPLQQMWITVQNKSFHTALDMIPYKEANRHYFNFKDTLLGYKLLNQSEMPLKK